MTSACGDRNAARCGGNFNDAAVATATSVRPHIERALVSDDQATRKALRLTTENAMSAIVELKRYWH